jgi:hypothetical protein
MSPAASWGLVLAILLAGAALAFGLRRHDLAGISACTGCGGRNHGRHPRQTSRMWGSPQADEPSAIDWCNGRRLVRVPFGMRLTRWGHVRELPDPRPRRERRAMAAAWPDDEPF